MTDAEALEVQCIENLQREDIHPLEEAHGFRVLLDLPDQQYTIARIGARAGKVGYVAGRLKLAELIPDGAGAFVADRTTLGHALVIVKLPGLDGVAKRYRLNVQEIEDSVASEFAGRRVKRSQKLDPALQACHQRGA
jgi:ParB-like chromosome segregation protein Spo0J